MIETRKDFLITVMKDAEYTALEGANADAPLRIELLAAYTEIRKFIEENYPETVVSVDLAQGEDETIIVEADPICDPDEVDMPDPTLDEVTTTLGSAAKQLGTKHVVELVKTVIGTKKVHDVGVPEWKEILEAVRALT